MTENLPEVPVSLLRRVIAGCLIGLLSSLAAPQARADITLDFGTQAFEKPTMTVAKLRPILDVLEREMSTRLGEPVSIRMQVRNNYRDAIRDLIGGVTDFARFGQAAYVIAKAAKRDLRLLAVEGEQRRKSFESVIIVHDDSAIRSLDNLVGKSFAFGDESSTVGRFMPQYFLSKANITRSLLQRIEYLGRHDRVAYAVADGRTDAGAVSKRVYSDLAANGLPIRSIASFGNVTMPWVAGSRLEPHIAAALTNSLLAMQGLEVLGLIKKDCFLPGGDDDYREVRFAIAENWRFFSE